MVKVILAAGLVSVLAACSHTGGGSYCDIYEPIRPTPEDVDVISGSLVEQILTENEKWAELCR